MSDSICLRGIKFKKIREQDWRKINTQNLEFLFISSSGFISDAGYVYLFTSNGAFYIKKSVYNNSFIDKYLPFIYDDEWNVINLYFCDLLIINPEIYNSFVSELCAKNIRDFWFQTAIDIYKYKHK